jgi:hypothetical protein
MTIELKNFFIYFDKNNPLHLAAVEEFQKALLKKAPEELENYSNWVKTYRDQNNVSNDILLDVPWYPQTDNYSLPDSTCNSSSCAMYLEFLKPGSLPSGPKGDNSYLRKVLAKGDSTDHSVQTKVLESYGINSTFKYNLSFDDLDAELLSGRPVVLGILHHGPESAPTGSGHMIICIGKTASGDYYVHDPYGSIYDGYTKAVTNGKCVIYKKSTLEKRWTVKHPKDGWGRILLSI